MAGGLSAIDGAEVTVSETGAIPSVHVKLSTIDGMTMTRKLNAHDPGVHVSASRVHEDVLVLNPVCLREGDIPKLIDAFKAALS